MKTDMKRINKNIEYYLNLPWKYTIEEDVDNDGKKIYIICINELPGVSSHGYSIEKAMESFKEAMALAFEMYIEAGDEIPEPVNENRYKGNIAYRTTPRRHYTIAQEAEKRNLSLSQFIDTVIDTAISKKN